MGMAMFTNAELRALSDQEVENIYDRVAGQTDPASLDFYRNELMRREFSKQNGRMERMTRSITWMTGAILILTVVNVILLLVHPPQPK